MTTLLHNDLITKEVDGVTFAIEDRGEAITLLCAECKMSHTVTGDAVVTVRANMEHHADYHNGTQRATYSVS